jgi:hypothetical protein
LSSITKNGKIESAFATYVGFGVLMISKLGTNEILMRCIAALVPWKFLKSWFKMKWYPLILEVEKADELKVLSKAFIFCYEFRYAVL